MGQATPEAGQEADGKPLYCALNFAANLNGSKI